MVLAVEDVADQLVARPVLALTGVFLLWKSVLLALATAAPGHGYDTSTSLLVTESSNFVQGSLYLGLVSKLTRWDAIYFVQLARRGHVFEQEWAFGKGLSTVLRLLPGASVTEMMWNGIILAHLTHYLSVIFLWKLVEALAPDSKTLPLLAAILHILAPAGIFLSSPYAESIFSCLSMLGFWLYVRSHLSISTTSLAIKFLAGVVLGLATSFRSNGVLAGVLFLFDLLDCGKEAWNGRFSFGIVVQAVTIVASGLCIFAGLAIPQLLAYQDYCGASGPNRPWCNSPLPSVYGFVQAHYWNVGFLKYWTLSNIPLFLLATPCLLLIFKSGLSILLPPETGHRPTIARIRTKETQRLAVIQLVLACLAITNYHVQIITRLSSAYPWTYIWLADQVGRSQYGRAGVVMFVLYAMIQASLYASFLPPA